MPRTDVKLDDAISRNPEGGDVFKARKRIVGEVGWRSDRDEPLLALQRTEALADPTVTGKFSKNQAALELMHDTKARLAIGHHQLNMICLLARPIGVGAIPLLSALARLYDIAIRREGLVSEILRRHREAGEHVHDVLVQL
jgi:hypothetical protein